MLLLTQRALVGHRVGGGDLGDPPVLTRPDLFPTVTMSDSLIVMPSTLIRNPEITNSALFQQLI